MGMNSPQRGSKTVLSEINVTPLVDVMLVLLIIFMVTAPLMQQGIEIELPKTANSGVEAKEEPLVISIKKNQSLYIGEAKVGREGLRQKLKAIFSTRKTNRFILEPTKRWSMALWPEPWLKFVQPASLVLGS